PRSEDIRKNLSSHGVFWVDPLKLRVLTHIKMRSHPGARGGNPPPTRFGMSTEATTHQPPIPDSIPANYTSERSRPVPPAVQRPARSRTVRAPDESRFRTTHPLGLRKDARPCWFSQGD